MTKLVAISAVLLWVSCNVQHSGGAQKDARGQRETKMNTVDHSAPIESKTLVPLGKANNVNWSAETLKKDGGGVVVTLHAVIDEGWHLYSQHLESDEGPIPTSFVWNKDQVSDPVEELTKVHEEYDPNFAMNVKFFEKQAQFRFSTEDNVSQVTGTISYMVCNDETCLPPVDLEVRIPVP